MVRRPFFVLALTAATLIGLQLPTSASPAPVGGTIRVTGFDRISLALGSSGAVTVEVRSKKEQAILSALDGLSPAARGTCVDTSTAFSLSFTDVRTHKPWVVTEDPCPTPGLVQISAGGVLLRRQIIKGGESAGQFNEDCRLAKAVLAALPRHGTAGTREDLRNCISQ